MCGPTELVLRCLVLGAGEVRLKLGSAGAGWKGSPGSLELGLRLPDAAGARGHSMGWTGG